jgi:hypothetical protein
MLRALGESASAAASARRLSPLRHMPRLSSAHARWSSASGKALGRRPGIPALVMAYSIGYEAKSLPVPGGIDILDVDRRAEWFVMPDDC